MVRMYMFLLVVAYSGASRDLDFFASIFPGKYDNILQHKSDINHHVPPNLYHVRVSIDITPQYIPILVPGTTFYLEEYTDGNTSALVRQRVYCFSQREGYAIRLKLFALRDPAKFAHSDVNSPLFANLTEDDVILIEGCDVFWKRVQEDLFKSHMLNTCFIHYNDIKVTVTDTNLLSPTYLTVQETWYVTSNGTVIRFNPVPYKLLKQQHTKDPLDNSSFIEVEQQQDTRSKI